VVTTIAKEETVSFAQQWALWPGLLIYWPSQLKVLAINLSQPSGQLGLYASLIGFHPCRLKVPLRRWAPTQRA